jgi:hypothetical protein
MINHKVKRLTLIAAITLGVTNAGWATTTVQLSAGLGEHGFATSGGEPIPDGNSVWIGTFAPGFDVGANEHNPSALQAAWSDYGTGKISSVMDSKGRLVGSVSSDDSAFNTQQIYWWAFNTSDNAEPTQAFGNVDDYGIFTSLDSSWVFPDQGVSMLSTTTSSQVIDTAYHGALRDGYLRLASASVTPAGVPEPGFAWVLIALGLFTSTRRSRR